MLPPNQNVIVVPFKLIYFVLQILHLRFLVMQLVLANDFLLHLVAHITDVGRVLVHHREHSSRVGHRRPGVHRTLILVRYIRNH